MKTDLAKIMAVSGQHGLYNYVAQARGGVIAESLSDKKRTAFDAHARITTLEDIAIYTDEGELRLSEVFKAMKETSKMTAAPTSKSPDSEIRDFFSKAVPNYDADRFYLSHMKKICDWYSEIDKYASFDFMTDEDRKNGEEA